MEFIPRKLLFKAWNQKTGLLMRLNSIDCVKGELFRKDHILLQFTGLYDQRKEEIYEMDVLMIGGKRCIVYWDPSINGWSLSSLPDRDVTRAFVRTDSENAIRLCSYFESRHAGQFT